MKLRALIFGIAFLYADVSFAQLPVAPTTESVGPTRGDDWHNYNFVNSLETGYRFVSTGGNTEQYRATENFGNGVRLLSGFFAVNSKDGHGKLFDEIVLTVTGLGGDPYESAALRVQKNHVYEYDLLWHRNDYFNPGLTTDDSAGVHLLNTNYTLQDHNLTLFPQSPIRFTLGYTRDTQTGAGISTVQLFNTGGQFDASGDIFPLFTNIRFLQNEFRLGGEIHWLGFTFNWMHAWQYFKDDTPYTGTGVSPGDNPSHTTSLTSFVRTQPNHGTSPYWRVGLFRNDPVVNINGRFTYTSGMRDFLSNELAIGITQRGVLGNEQILTFGNARRPAATGNLSISLFPTKKLTIVNQTSLYSIRTDGNSAYLQFDNSTGTANVLYYQYLGIRTVANETDAKYQVSSWLDLHGGYEYSNRKISSTSQFAISGTPGTLPYFQTNELNSGNFGFRITPIKQLTIVLDDELGRANRPFTPKSDKDYNILAGRITFQAKKLQLTATSRSNYNDNSISVTAYSSHGRVYSGSASWNPVSWFGLDATYSKIHIDTLGGIAFFAQAQLFPNQVSYYVSNIHAGTLTARLHLKIADLYFGYSHIQDTGDGRVSPADTSIGPTLTPFQAAQTFPLRFESPLARLSFRISERVRWNVGYQYFGYNEMFYATENYHATTGYTSLLWSF